MRLKNVLAAVAFGALVFAASPSMAMYAGNTSYTSPTTQVYAPGSMFTSSILDTLAPYTQLEYTFTVVNGKLDTAMVYGAGILENDAVTSVATYFQPNPTPAVSGDTMVTAAANIQLPTVSDPNTMIGTAIIKNLSAAAIGIQILFSSFVKGVGSYSYAWQTTTVPLPAALPLFGVGLASLAAVGARKKKKA